MAVEYTQFESSPRRSKLPVNVSFSVRWCQLTQQSARQKRKRNLQCARWNWKPSENRRQNPEDNGCWDSSRKVSQWLKQRMDKVALAKVIVFHSHSSSSWLILFHSFWRQNWNSRRWFDSHYFVLKAKAIRSNQLAWLELWVLWTVTILGGHWQIWRSKVEEIRKDHSLQLIH